MLFAHQVSGQRVLCSVRGAPRLAACPSRTFKPARHGDAAVTCAGKGFGAPKTDSETAKQEKCYCGSGKLRAECCSPIIKGARKAESPEELLRARFTSFVSGEIDFLVASTHPHYHQFAYGTAPGGASAQLKGDLIKSVKETEYRGLVVTSANATSSPPAAAAATDGTGAAAADNSEAVIEFSYQKSDRLDKRQKFFIDRQTRQWETTFEKSKFMKGKDGGWLFAESQRFEMAANDVSAQVQKIRADMAAKKAAGADTPPAAAPAPAAPAPSS